MEYASHRFSVVTIDEGVAVSDLEVEKRTVIVLAVPDLEVEKRTIIVLKPT